jgi:hypothetical protein
MLSAAKHLRLFFVISELAVIRPEFGQRHLIGLNFVHALTDSSSRYGQDYELNPVIAEDVVDNSEVTP